MERLIVPSSKKMLLSIKKLSGAYFSVLKQILYSMYTA